MQTVEQTAPISQCSMETTGNPSMYSNCVSRRLSAQTMHSVAEENWLSNGDYW